MLGFLAPAFLAGLLAVAIPIVLHLARRRVDRVVDFPAVHMVPEAPLPLRERRQLRDLWLLALRVAALALLAFAFARPYFTDTTLHLAPPTTIVALDTSLSLSAPGQWDAARDAAARAIDGAPSGQTVGLVTFDDRATLVVAPTPDRGLARAALATLAPTGGGTRYLPALARSAEALGPSGGRVVVVTDLQAAGWLGEDATGVPDGIDVSLVPVAAPAANLAVTGVTRAGRRLTATVQSYASGPRTVTARARVNGRDYGRATVEVAARASAEVQFDAAWPSSGAVEVGIDDAEGYALDNTRYAALEVAPPPSLLIVTSVPPESAPTGLYVQRALEAGLDGGDREAAADVRVTDGRRFTLGEGRPPGAIFVVGTRTLDRNGRAALARYVRGGGHVFLTLGPDIDLPSLSEVFGSLLRVAPDPVEATGAEAALVPSDRRHPVLRQLLGSATSISRLSVERYHRLLDEQGWRVLARFAGGAVALAERPMERGTILLFASDVDNRWNRFPLEPSFAPFIVEAARYLTRDTHAASAYTLPDVPPAVTPAPGVQQLPAEDGQPARTIVINTNPRESDPAGMTTEAFLAAVPRRAAVTTSAEAREARAREADQRLWQIVLAVMLAVLVIEGVLGRRPRRLTAREPGVG